MIVYHHQTADGCPRKQKSPSIRLRGTSYHMNATYGRTEEKQGDMPRASAPPRRFRLSYPGLMVLIIVFASLLYLPVVNSTLYFQGGDNAKYLSLARSLARGSGYTNIDTHPETPHVKCGPLFPVLLASIIRTAGEDIALMKMLVALSAVFTAALWYGCLRRCGEIRFSAPAAFLATAAPFVVLHSCRLLPQIPFTFLCIAALYFFVRSEEHASLRQRDICLAVAFMLAAYFMRPAGIALCVALSLAALFRKSSRERRQRLVRCAVFAAAGGSAVLGWSIRNHLVRKAGPGASYLSEFLLRDPYDPSLGPIGISDLFSRFSTNSGEYMGSALRVALGVQPENTTLAIALGIIFLAAVMVGFGVRVREKRDAPEWFTACYVVFLPLWPFVAERFLIPVIPLLVFYFLKGIDAIISLAGNRRWSMRTRQLSSTALAVVTACLLAFECRGDYTTVRMLRSMTDGPTLRINPHFEVKVLDPRMAPFMAAGIYVRKHLGPDTILVARKPRLAALVGGCPAMGFPYDPDPVQVKDWLVGCGATHLIRDDVYEETQKYLVPALEKYPDVFELVQKMEGSQVGLFRILQQTRAGPHPPDSE